MKSFCLIICLIFFVSISCGQSWRVLDSLCYDYGDIQPDSAILLGKKAIEGCVKEKGKNSLEYAACLDHIAWGYKTRRKFSIADSLYQEAIKICKEIKKTGSRQYVDIVTNLGLIYQEKAKYIESEQLLIEAKNITANTFGKENPHYATSCNNLGLLYEAQGKYSEAELSLIEAIETEGKISDKKSVNYANFSSVLAHLYQSQGRYQESERLFVEAKNLFLILFGKEHVLHATSCNNLASLYQSQGRYSEAEPLFMEAKNIWFKVFGKKHPDYAIACNNMAVLYKLQGKYVESELLFIEAKNIWGEVFGKEHPNYAGCCTNLAVLYKSQNKYTQAESLYIEAKNIYIKVLGNKHPNYARSCNNIGAFYSALGKYEKAESFYSEAKNIWFESLGNEHPDYAYSCSNLADIYTKQGKYTKAESLYTESKNIRIKVLGKEHPMYANSCNSLALCYQKQGRYSEAEPLYIEAINIKQKEIERNFSNLSEVEKEKYLNANISDYFNSFQRFISIYFCQKPEISKYGYELSIATKGLILSSSEKIKNRILGSNNEKLKKMYLEWKNTKDKYNKTLNLSTEQVKQKKLNLDSLQKAANEYEKQLALESEDFTAVFTPKHITWKDIQNRLKKYEANVEIVKYQTNNDSAGYIAYIIKKDSPYPEAVVLQNGNELEKTANAYRRAIRSKLKDDFSYNIFWKPISDKLKGIKHVYFCPDGAYHQINLNTLQNAKTHKYVFDEIKISQVSNSKDILQTKKFKETGVYLIGNPKYEIEKESPKGNQRDVEFMDFSSGITQLQGAEDEVKSIDSLVKIKDKSTTLYIQEQAAEEKVQSLKNPRILHIATHGYFKRGKYESAEQAMRNAGLLMAGVVDIDKMYLRPYDREDGKLTAFEIMNMQLDSTELVVLSACETGLGEVSKEGVYGLQRAFKVAGAGAVIMSLWKVDDFATQKLMKNFYYYWQVKGMNKKTAFLKAQLDLRKINPEPYYWGAFVMIE